MIRKNYEESNIDMTKGTCSIVLNMQTTYIIVLCDLNHFNSTISSFNPLDCNWYPFLEWH